METYEACTLLGISPGASSDEVRRAFVARAKTSHPDHPGGTDALFRAVREAREHLLLHGTGPRLASPESRDGADVSISVEVGLADLVGSCEVALPQGENGCAACGGTGRIPLDRPVGCTDCRGEGVVVRYFGTMSTRSPCRTCGGTGVIADRACASCASGTPRLPATLFLPSGTRDGDVVSVARAGEAGRGGGGSGDLHVTVSVRPEPRFAVRGDDLAARRYVSFADLVLGASLGIAGVDGERHPLPVPPGSAPGTVLEIADAGLGRKDGGRGRLLVRLDVRVPSAPTQAQKAWAARWRELDARP